MERRSAAEIMRDAEVPNMLESRRLNLRTGKTMIVHMPRHANGLYCRVGLDGMTKWVQKDKANVWTTRDGAAAVLLRVADEPIEIVSFELREIHEPSLL